MKKKIIFVGGVHGVGKTTLCESMRSRLEVQHISASTLISRQKNISFSVDKKTDAIADNQLALIKAIDELDPNIVHLIDGHYCLLGKNGEVERVPIDTFIQMSPIGIVLLLDDEERISTRFEERDKIKYGVDKLKAFQKEEVEYFNQVSNVLGVPCLTASPTKEYQKIYDFVKRFTA